jgi:hypothetical protein
MAYRPIPEGAIEAQTGLWAKFTPLGTITRCNIYAADGYCFYNLQQAENFDEEGNLLPENERTYALYAIAPFSTVEQVNAIFVSVPYEEGYNVC